MVENRAILLLVDGWWNFRFSSNIAIAGSDAWRSCGISLEKATDSCGFFEDHSFLECAWISEVQSLNICSLLPFPCWRWYSFEAVNSWSTSQPPTKFWKCFGTSLLLGRVNVLMIDPCCEGTVCPEQGNLGVLETSFCNRNLLPYASWCCIVT